MLIQTIRPYVELHRSSSTGIAYIKDGTTGLSHSLHPSIDSSGSVAGMKKLGYWDKADVCVRTGGFVYNTSRYVPDENNELNDILLANCHCGGNHGQRED